jgi:hypothetical protein
MSFPTTSWLLWQKEQRKASSDPVRFKQFSPGMLLWRLSADPPAGRSHDPTAGHFANPPPGLCANPLPAESRTDGEHPWISFLLSPELAFLAIARLTFENKP